MSDEIYPSEEQPPESEDGPTAGAFPWQQRDEVDLDLRGAPTWDPGQYSPDDDATASEMAPGRRFRLGRPRPEPSPRPGRHHAAAPAAPSTDQVRVDAERAQAHRVEAERRAAADAQAQRAETERVAQEQRDAQRREDARLDRERREAQQLEADRAEAERIEAARLEAERVEAARVEAARLEAERVEAARLEAERIEAARLEAERVEAARLEAQRVEAARLEAGRVEAARLEAERIEAARLEAERVEAARVEAARVEAARVEAARVEAARVEAARVEAARVEAARVEAARVEAERQKIERLEAERLDSERREALRAEVARADAARAEAARSAVSIADDIPVDLIGEDELGPSPVALRGPQPSSAVAPVTAAAESRQQPVDVVAAQRLKPEPRPAGHPSPHAARAPEATAQEATAQEATVHPAPVRPVPAATQGRPSRPSPFVNPMPTAVVASPVASAKPDLTKTVETSRTPEAEVDNGDVAAKKRAKGNPVFGFLGRHKRGLIRTFVVLIVAAAVAIVLRVYVVQTYYIPSASMEPTLHGCPGCTDDRVVVDKLSRHFRDFQVGDIVVFNKPPDAVGIPDNVLIKRVVALGGDTVSLKKDKLYVDGAPADESYLNMAYLNKNCPGQIALPLSSTTSWKVPTDDVFVLGDNRCMSDDGRSFGPIKQSSIIGRAVLIIYPFNRFGSI